MCTGCVFLVKTCFLLGSLYVQYMLVSWISFLNHIVAARLHVYQTYEL